MILTRSPAVSPALRVVLVLFVAAACAYAAKAQPLGTPPAVAPHCISAQPDKLALTDEQLDRILAIVHREPDSPRRRSEVLGVLTETQRMIYRNSAGIAAC